MKSDERFRGAFEYAPFGIYVGGPDGRIIQVNAAFCRMLGYSEQELLDIAWSDLTHPEDLKPAQDRKDRLWTGLSEWVEAETRYIHRTGTVVWTRIRVSLVRDGGNNPSYSVVHVEDITERKRTEDALRESEDRFRIMADGCPTLMWVTNAEGGNQFVNRAYREFAGISYEQVEGGKWQLLVHPEDAPKYLELFRLAIQQHSPFRAEARVRRADAEWRWLDSYAEPRLSATGEFLGHVGLSTDVTERRQTEEALQFQYGLIRAIHEVSLDGILVVNDENHIVSHNRRFLDIWRIPLRDIPDNLPDYPIGDQPPLVLTAVLERVKDPDAFLKRIQELNDDPEATEQREIALRDGRTLERYSTGLRSETGLSQGRAWFFRDITERREAEQRLQSSEEKFRQLTENIREVFWMMDPAATEIVYVSPAYEQIWGQTCQGLCANPKSWISSIHPEDRSHAEEIFRRQVQGDAMENEYRIVQPSGAIRWIRDRAVTVRDRDGNIVRLAGVAEDTTERKLSELRLVHQALYDELTDLPNRRLFMDRLGRAITECDAVTSGAVFFIDLDDFKLVNDTLGHSAGDQLLKEVAGRLLAVCGESATLARFGGDEFLLVATGFRGPESANDLAEKLIKCLDEVFRIADRRVFIGASIGISLFPENGITPDDLNACADMAMHEAKRAGKNQVRFFTPEFADASRERLEMETRLRMALALLEFKLQFQPQFASGRSCPSRFEALIRWYPPDDQPVPPEKFIPIAEQNGLIIQIGTWVLREACLRCAGWQNGELKGAGVAVNVSASQFACRDFVEIVVRTLESTRLPPQLLELELTERVLLQDVKESVQTLTTLRNLGVTIALDDFGTGYSSLSYLQNLPLDALKIDRSFLIETESRKQGAAVLRCVVELAHTLGLRVVGEGVETSAQLDLLGSLGCDEIQGFFLGEPSFDVAAAGDARFWKPAFFGDDTALPALPAACIVGKSLSETTLPGY